MSEAFGIMDQAYFVGRQEILKWMNDLLQVINLNIYILTS